METLPGYIQGIILPQAQDEKLATYTKILKKEDGLLDFNQSAVTLARKVRAFDPWPGTYLPIGSDNLKVKRAHPEEGSFQPGRHGIWNGTPAIATAQGLLVLDEVQPSGRRSMTGRAFLSGARDWLDPV